MFKTKLQSLLLALVLVLQSFIPSAFAGFLNARAYGADTVAGYASLLKSSVLGSDKDIIFVVEKPDFSVVKVPAKSNPEGIAQADLYGHQTKLAGSYKVALYYPGTPDASPQSVFRVYPDRVSPTQSMLSSTMQMLEADGLTKTYLTVTLYDAYRNPIKDHSVKLISSRQDDDIQPLSAGITDAAGRTSFKVSSKYDGVSVFSAMDTSANTILSDREEIVFYAPSKPIGGNYLSTDVFQASIIDSAYAQEVLPGPIDHFEVEGLGATVKVNEDLTMTIVAKDKDGNIAKNYSGGIIISTPDDENAILPNNGEYTFREADQGKFTFNLALRFTTVGQQSIQILDKNDWKISGEKKLEVVPQQSITVPDISKSLVIKSPLDGAQFGSNLVIVSGQGDPNINLKIFDDDVKIGDSETDSDGFFTFQAGNLAAGPHSFYVMSGQGDVSKTVSVNVDTLPPVLNSIEVTPQGVVKPGTNLNIVLSSEPSLDGARIRLQGVERDLQPQSGQPGSYAISIAAPAISGSFPIDVILVDSLANTAELRGQHTVLVEEAKASAPPTVQNPAAIAGDQEVLLTWDAVTGHSSDISYYKVLYGTGHDSLDQVLETADSTSTLKIGNLTNDRQYFFAVRAVDAKNAESAAASTVIAVTPVGPASEVIPTEPGAEDELSPSAQETDLIGMPPASLYNNPLTGTATSNTVTLSWQPFPGVNAAYYKVYLGLRPSYYDDYIVTMGNTTGFAVKDLINGVPYTFAVAALDYNGNEVSPLSAEFTIAPQGAGFQSLPADQVQPGRPSYTSPLSNSILSQVPNQEDTGPVATYVLVASLTLAAGFAHFHRRRHVRK